MRTSAKAALAAGAAILLAGCGGSGSSNTGTHYTSAQAIADKMAAAGFTVSALHKDTGTAISSMGGTVYNLAISQKTEKAAPDSSGINMFPNHETLASWTATSKSFGGVAVTGDTWAVSLPSDGAARTASLTMAPRIATLLGGTVQK